MNATIYHFTPDFLNLLVDTIPKLCKSKKDVLIFFSSAGVSQKSFADISEQLQKDPSSINKYEIARTILVRLNEAGDDALRERREIVKRVTEFEDFSRCWENDQAVARGLVAKVRETVNFKDYFTRMQQVIESNLQEDRKKRQAEEQARVDALKSKRQKREKIKFELIKLYQETNPQKRGKELESILNRFFESENILVRESFTITGENNEGIIQQIDGAIEVNNHLYLVEMKWCKEALSPGDVAQHMMRIFLRSDARGIFISESGYTDAAIIDIKKALSQKLIVLFTLKDFVVLLEGDDSFESLLRTKVEAVQLEQKLMY